MRNSAQRSVPMVPSRRLLLAASLVAALGIASERAGSEPPPAAPAGACSSAIEQGEALTATPAPPPAPTPTILTLTGCDGCHNQPCGPLCPDGSPSAICANTLESAVCGCVFVGCAPSPCTECSCTGDRNGDGQVTIDEIVVAVNNALNGCPPPTPTPQLRWYPGCGPPVVGQNACPSDVEFCTTEQMGAPCSQAGATCCQPGSDCTGNWCNAPLVCSTKPPDTCPISRRRYKRDIEYLGRASLTQLRDELLAIKLATYRYKYEAPSAQPHLGFIIDDIEPSVSVDSRHDKVDLYGYLSMAVGAVQVQATEITALRQEIEDLRQELNQLKPGASQRAAPEAANGASAELHGLRCADPVAGAQKQRD